MYYVYILRCSDNSLYTGITHDIIKRVKIHYYKEQGSAKYTRSHQVTAVEAVWEVTDKSTALRLEHFIKSLKKEKKQDLIENISLLNEIAKDKISDDYCLRLQYSLEDILNGQ